MLTTQLLIGTILIALTVIIHAFLLHGLLSFVRFIAPKIHVKSQSFPKIAVLTITVIGIFFSHTAQMWLWASFYFFNDILSSFEEALYFSVATFSTVGYGDVVLDKNWRLLSGIQSANGLMLFGWSTAL